MKFQIGDEIEIKGKVDGEWHRAVVVNVGVSSANKEFFEYKLHTPVMLLNLYTWKDGIYDQDRDPYWDEVRMISPVLRKKRYNLLYNVKNGHYYTEEIK